jgi:glycolate oxidase
MLAMTSVSTASAELIERLREILPADAILADSAERFVYEFDALTIARATPAAIVFPRSAAQVVAVVKLLAEMNVPITPRGSGTGLAGGCVAFENGVVVSTARMNRILAIDLENRVAHVEAGVRNVQLSEAVAQLPGGSSYHFAPDPSSQRASTIGGNAATNAGGVHTLKDFVSSNHVLGMEIVLADGSLVEVGAYNGCYDSPFDLSGLICGSEGTFGILTRLWVRLAPKRESFRTMVAMFSSSPDACNAVSDIIGDGFLPAAMEMMDGRMVQVIENAYHLGFPPEAQASLLIEIDGIEALLDGQMNEILEICRRNRAIRIDTSSDPATRAKMWKARKSAFGAIGRIARSCCTQDACVPRSMLAEVLQRIGEIGREFGLDINNVFHAGDGNIHPIFLYDDRNEAQVQNVLHAAEKMLKYCIDIGGTITGEHGVGVEKIHLMPYLFDQPTMQEFARVKHAFDPDERINAGKLVPSDKVQITLLKPGRNVPQ